ncbi:MAG: SLC13/DASS family transporter [SAR324 cluster bacterium]|nr:SLC13/DASS family transporter [SAR324 cluster bacterium]
MNKLFFAFAVPIVLAAIPRELIPIVNMTVIEHRMLAIFVMAVLFWVLEPIPIFATSVMVVALQLVTISNRGMIWLRDNGNESEFGELLDYKDLLQTFASPIIMLFLGGFFLAIAATKYRLDVNLARVFLRPFGSNPQRVMLGLMLITAVFSMFMSNTATTALMLAVLAPVLKLFRPDDPGRIAFVLCIPFAANIGGIGTPIGTPPNAVAMKYLTGEISIGFGEWMVFGVPFSLLLLFFAWRLLLWFSPPQEDKIGLLIQGSFLKSRQAIIVYFIFGSTILLWLTEHIHGMSSHVVAMLPVTVFVATRIVTSKDLKKISWDVLWLISGGIALGLGLEKTGLSKHMIESVPLDRFPPILIILIATFLAIMMSTFISNTATANLLLPLVAALGSSLSSLEALGGDKLLILLVAFSCSLAMGLPISTPPNAMAYATDMIGTKELLKSGCIVGGIGLLLLYLMAYILRQIGFV